MVKKDPVLFKTILEGNGYAAHVEEVAVGHIEENVTFLDDALELEKANQKWTPAVGTIYFGIHKKFLKSRQSRTIGLH